MSASRSRARLLALALTVWMPAGVHAQQEPIGVDQVPATVGLPSAQSVRTEANSTVEGDEIVRWNGGLDVTSIHTSNTGWATLATPSFGYRFSDIFSIDAVLPIYFYRLAETRAPRAGPNASLVDQRGELADFILSGHAEFIPRFVNYQLTGAVTAPTGDEAYGLTTGRVTFDVSNQFDRTFGRFTPAFEIGAGDSSTLVNRLVTKNYTSLGPLAHAQAGLNTQILSRVSFEADAYEQLPLGDQKIYTSKRTRANITTFVTGHNVTEDNGFDAAVYLAIDPHTTLTTYYNRSLRLHTDTAAVGITFYLRPAATVVDEPVFGDLIR